jgi:hypothetical protein
MGGEDTTTTDTDEEVIFIGTRGGRDVYLDRVLDRIVHTREVVDDNGDDNSETAEAVTALDDKLDRQFETMYYIIAILVILIIVVGYYLYIKEGALGM